MNIVNCICIKHFHDDIEIWVSEKDYKTNPIRGTYIVSENRKPLYNPIKVTSKVEDFYPILKPKEEPKQEYNTYGPYGRYYNDYIRRRHSDEWLKWTDWGM